MYIRNHTRIYQIVFVCLSILFLLDTFFIHYLIPWGSSSYQKTIIHDSYDAIGEPVNDLDPVLNTKTRDIRTRSTFTGQIPGTKANSRIPKIIHQTWNTEDIPEIFHKWMLTWKKQNPDWEYWFWSLNETRTFVSREYPDFLSLYDLYTEDIFRSDALRYLVLYKYGGMYMDLDMEALKPLDDWTTGFNCIVSEETYEHPFIVREQDPPGNIVNGFIAARPQHPLLKLAVDSLEEFAGIYFGDYLQATGPYFFNAVLDRYLKRLARGYQVNKETDDVTILPPKYFFPTYDPNESDIITSRCYPGKYQLLKESGQITCKELLKTSLRRSPVNESYTDHHWVHAYLFHSEWRRKNTKHLLEIIPSAITKHVK